MINIESHLDAALPNHLTSNAALPNHLTSKKPSNEKRNAITGLTDKPEQKNHGVLEPKKLNSTIDFYNCNAETFIERTLNVTNMKDIWEIFEFCIPDGGHILDLGSGSGRDSLHFKEMGYKVTALDGSEEMAKRASKFLGQEVLVMNFADMEFESIFDGVWACGSLLHVPHEELKDILKLISRALKPHGILYASWKQGKGKRIKDGREFYDMTREDVKKYTNGIFKVTSLWVTDDGRGVKERPRWVNMRARKL